MILFFYETNFEKNFLFFTTTSGYSPVLTILSHKKKLKLSYEFFMEALLRKGYQKY